MSSINTLSIIVPAYNEAKTILQVIQRLSSLPFDIPVEIIVVDDGSTDATKEALSSTNSLCVVEALPHNRGKGYAMRHGAAIARGEWVAFVDADLENDPNDLFALIEAARTSDADAVHGSRLLGNTKKREGTSPFFFWGGRLLTSYVNLLYGTSLTDVTTGFRLIRRSVFNALPLTSERFSIETELVALHALQWAKIIEVPISYRPRAVAAGKKLRLMDGVRAAIFALRLRLASLLPQKQGQRRTTRMGNDISIQDREATQTGSKE
jgi:dolichol-phosphate mannosyltransferase